MERRDFLVATAGLIASVAAPELMEASTSQPHDTRQEVDINFFMDVTSFNARRQGNLREPPIDVWEVTSTEKPGYFAVVKWDDVAKHQIKWSKHQNEKFHRLRAHSLRQHIQIKK